MGIDWIFMIQDRHMAYGCQDICQEKTRRTWTKIKKSYWPMERRSALSIHNKLMLYKQILNYLRAREAYSCGNARNRATLTSFNDFKTRYLGTALMHLGISETQNSIGTFKWRWLRMNLESSLRSMKKGVSTISTSKRSSCSTTVNYCEGFKKNPFVFM